MFQQTMAVLGDCGSRLVMSVFIVQIISFFSHHIFANHAYYGERGAYERQEQCLLELEERSLKTECIS